MLIGSENTDGPVVVGMVILSGQSAGSCPPRPKDHSPWSSESDIASRLVVANPPTHQAPKTMDHLQRREKKHIAKHALHRNCSQLSQAVAVVYETWPRSILSVPSLSLYISQVLIKSESQPANISNPKYYQPQVLPKPCIPNPPT